MAGVPGSRPSRDRGAALLVLLALLALGGTTGASDRQAPAAPGAPDAPEAAAVLDQLESAWAARDRAAWLALWDAASPEEKAAEGDVATDAFAADETRLSFLQRPRPAPGATYLFADAQVFVAKEPHARVDYWHLRLEKREGRWAVVAREPVGNVEGFVHLSLGPKAWRARGVSLQLEDFELRMEDGTLFTTPESVGATGLVFVGRARVRFTPFPAAEREQLRQLRGTSSLDLEVPWAFVRLHPASFSRVLDTGALQPEPAPLERRAVAERVWRERSGRSFLVDAPLPRSPWWLMPNPGDAVVDFPVGRQRVLTFVVAGSDPEDLNLFDRDRRLQICSYPSRGRPARYSEDDGRTVDVLSHDLTVRFEPEDERLEAVDTLRLRLLAPIPTLRLRLDDSLQVSSVTSDDGGRLLFFRVREQGSLVVLLGPNSSRPEAFGLTVRYGGRHNPAPVDQELVQLATSALHLTDDGFVDRPPLVYSNRTAWYPRPANEDFASARARVDTPEGWLAVTGGDLLSSRTEGGRVRSEYLLQQPGKYLTAIVGRLEDLGLRQEGDLAVRGFATARLHSEVRRQMVTAQEILAFYAGLFGPCPYPTVNVVIAEGPMPAGHSPPAMVYLLQQPPILRSNHVIDDPANFSDLPGFFLAHELAHQWWGQGVAPANYRERWLSEAWAQYAASLWIRHDRGEGAFQGMMDRMAAWAFRGDDAGPIHLGQRIGHLKGDPKLFRAVVYDKGAWALHMLRGILGDEAFFGGARAFLEAHRYAKAGSEDLQEALEKAGGRDLAPYFERWVFGTELPTLAWSSRTERTGGGFRTTVEVRPRALPGPLPLEIAIYTAKGPEVRRVTLDPAGGSWTIETALEARRVALNEDRGLLARIERVGARPVASPQR